jgi:hypothetical protein
MFDQALGNHFFPQLSSNRKQEPEYTPGKQLTMQARTAWQLPTYQKFGITGHEL